MAEITASFFLLGKISFTNFFKYNICVNIDHQTNRYLSYKMTTRSIELTFYDVIFSILIDELSIVKQECDFMIEKKTVMRKYLSL
jgi:hypothetical protein